MAAYLLGDDSELVYEVPAVWLEEWAEESFVVDEGAKSVGDVMVRKRMPKYWALTYLPHSCEALCHKSHWRSDSIGVTQLLDALLKLIADPNLSDPTTLPWREEVERLSPSIETIAKIPEIHGIHERQKDSDDPISRHLD